MAIGIHLSDAKVDDISIVKNEFNTVTWYIRVSPILTQRGRIRLIRRDCKS